MTTTPAVIIVPPATCKVLGKTFTIEYRESTSTDDPDAGECSIAKQQIKIDLGYHHEFNQETLLHELLHAIDDTLNLRSGERRIGTLAPSLLAVMKDNPAICHFIFGERPYLSPVPSADASGRPSAPPADAADSLVSKP